MKIVWSRRAIRHLVRLRDYIEKQSDRNAAFVATRILKAVDLLESHPDMGRPGRIVGTRELACRIPLTSSLTGFGANGWS